KEMEFERLGVFKYSREEGTPAYNYKDQVSEKEKQKRFNAIMSAQQAISIKINKKFNGRTLKVLIEEKNRDCYTGRTEYDAPDIDGMVYVKGDNLKIGDFYNVKITDSYEYDLVGHTT
ncbi:MAG: TRAM domain-containing protein, partial [Candidatus Omnitrophota bacterium]|nr:TRAM domain-containing protein [Candidatus Omnitrophota bacterium]